MPPASSSGHSGHSLSEKVGPMPLWMWIGLGIVVVVGFYIYEKNKSSAAAEQAAAATTTALGTPTGGAVSTPSVGENAVAPGGTGSSYPTTSDWESAALSAVEGTGTYTPTDVLSALQTFLAGGQLNAQQTSIIDAALNTVGAPPGLSTTPSVQGTPGTTSTLARPNSLAQLFGAGSAYGQQGESDVLSLIGNTITHTVTNSSGAALNTEQLPGQWTSITGQGWAYSPTLKTLVYYVEGNGTNNQPYVTYWSGSTGEFSQPVTGAQWQSIVGGGITPYAASTATG